MQIQRRFALLLTLSLIAMVALIASCSDKSTNPLGGGVTPPKELDSGDIGPGGGQFVHTFNTAGTFNYHCTKHAGMPGQVVVGNPGSPMNASVTITDFAFTPSPVNVATTGTVTWTNNGSLHTVTSD